MGRHSSLVRRLLVSRQHLSSCPLSILLWCMTFCSPLSDSGCYWTKCLSSGKSHVAPGKKKKQGWCWDILIMLVCAIHIHTYIRKHVLLEQEESRFCSCSCFGRFDDPEEFCTHAESNRWKRSTCAVCTKRKHASIFSWNSLWKPSAFWLWNEQKLQLLRYWDSQTDSQIDEERVLCSVFKSVEVDSIT